MKKILFLFVIVIIFIISNIQLANCQQGYGENNYAYQYLDNYNRMITYTQYQNNNWTNVNLEETKFDNHQRIIEDIYKTWNNGIWAESTRDVYNYDSISLINSHEFYKWDNNSWILNSNDTLCYLSNGKINWESQYYYFINNMNYKYLYDYNHLTNNIEEIYLHNALNNNIIIRKYRNTYNISGQINNSCDYLIDSASNWYLYDSTFYYYDIRNNISKINYWGFIPNGWNCYKYETFDYDSLGNKINYYQNGFPNGPTTITYKFDSLQRLTQEVQQLGDVFQTNSKVVIDYSYDDNNRIINKREIVHWYINGIIYNNSTYNVSKLSCFPNPFSITTNIKYTLDKADNVSLVIYSVSGSEMSRINLGFEDSGEHTYNYNAAELQSGFYYYVLHIGSKSYVNKMEIIR